MAIEFSYTSLQGVAATAAYHQVTRVDYVLENNPNCSAIVKVYKDKTAKTAGFEPLDINTVTFNLTFGAKSTDCLAQAYVAVKKLTEVIDKYGNRKAVNYKTGGIKDV